MIEMFSVQGFDQAQIVGVLRQMRQQFGKRQPAFTVLVVVNLSPQQFGCSANERESLTSQKFLRAVLSVEFDQFRFELEQLEMRRTTHHMQKDDVLRFGWKMRIADSGCFWTRTRSAEQIVRQQRRERDRAKPVTGPSQQIAAGVSLNVLNAVCHRSAIFCDVRQNNICLVLSVFRNGLIEVEQDISQREPDSAFEPLFVREGLIGDQFAGFLRRFLQALSFFGIKSA